MPSTFTDPVRIACAPVSDLLHRVAALAEARERGYAERLHGGVVNSQCANGLVELLPEIQAAAQLQAGTRGDQYRAELYDEVWQQARAMGYSNVNEALAALARVQAASGLARMSAPDLAAGAVLVVEQARVKSSGAPIGLRLTTRPGGQSLLVFYDQVAMPGFRLGDAFIADPDDPLAYSILDLKPAEAAR